MKQSMKKESQELLKSRMNLPDFSSLIIQDLSPLTKDIIINQPTFNISLIGEKGKGKTTFINSLSKQMPTQVKAEKEPERTREREKNFSQQIGYVNIKLYKCIKCPEPDCYKSFNSQIESDIEIKCTNCGNKLELLRHVCFIDDPELSIKMNMILNPIMVSDAILLFVAADENLKIKEAENNNLNNNNKESEIFYENSLSKNIIIIQNKIDKVMKSNKAKQQYQQIKKYATSKNAQNSLIIPISAQLNFNLDALIQYLISIQIPKRDLLSPPKYYILHSFYFSNELDESQMINKNGTLYGILTKGLLKIGDKVEILPGICIKTNNKEIRTSPVYGRITILQNEKNLSNYVIPGGIINIGLKVDSESCKNNKLEGNILGLQEKVGTVFYKIGVKCHFLRKLIKIEKNEWGHYLDFVTDIKKGEVLLLNINYMSVGGDIVNIKGINSDEIYFELRKPICIEISEKIILSRKTGSIWRIIGWGEIISEAEEDVIIT